MYKEKLKRSYKEKKSLVLSIRITPTISRWLRDNNYSPTGIFNEAVRELKGPTIR